MGKCDCVHHTWRHFDVGFSSARCQDIHTWFWVRSQTCVFSLHKHRFSRASGLYSMLMHMFLGCTWRWRIDLTAVWLCIIMQALCVPARIEPQNCPLTAFDDRLHFDSTLDPSFSPCCTLSCPSFVSLSGLFLVNTLSLWTISVHFPWVVLPSDSVTSAACALVLLRRPLSCIALFFVFVEFF